MRPPAGLAIGPFASLEEAVRYADAHGGRERYAFETIRSPYSRSLRVVG